MPSLSEVLRWAWREDNNRVLPNRHRDAAAVDGDGQWKDHGHHTEVAVGILVVENGEAASTQQRLEEHEKQGLGEPASDVGGASDVVPVLGVSGNHDEFLEVKKQGYLESLL